MKMFLLGMVVMSVFSAIGAMIVENGKKEGLGYLLMGPAIWITWILNFVVKQIHETTKYWGMKSLVIDKDGQIKRCSIKNGVNYKYADFTKLGYSHELWKKDFRNNGLRVASTKYVPKIVWQDFEEIKK